MPNPSARPAWCFSLDSNQPLRVRSAESSSRGRSERRWIGRRDWNSCRRLAKPRSYRPNHARIVKELATVSGVEPAKLVLETGSLPAAHGRLHWVDRPDLPRRGPASQAGASLLGHGQHTQRSHEPESNRHRADTNRTVDPANRGGGRDGTRTHHFSDTDQAFNPLDFTADDLGPMIGLEPTRTS
jgi:hypothetical protein